MSFANLRLITHQHIDATTLNSGLVASPNFDPDALSDVVAQALSTSTTGNSSTSNRDDTVEHNVIEHDGYFSRDDIYRGHDLHFNANIGARQLHISPRR
ncbi:putative Chloroperoxidase [Seiridium cardinale]|uniref:Chloroperoxidase n=1 Tax=Seiridium cardinale TaxID=138064 RepID=A0ABR2XR01_9PEZI